VLGKRVRELIVDNSERVQFFSPDVAYADARKYLPTLLEKTGVKSEPAISVLNALQTIVWPLELDVYARFKSQALQSCALLAVWGRQFKPVTKRHGLTALGIEPLFEFAPVGTGIRARSQDGANIHHGKPPFFLVPNTAELDY
jgi:hypothetical protein